MGRISGIDRTYARNDLVRNKVVNIALGVVLVLSAFLMATGAMVTERLTGSVGELFASAKPPHYLQMHKGDYDTAALERFAAEHPEIQSWFVEEMVGIDGSQLRWERPGSAEEGDFSSSLIDNLFVTQSPDFDLLLAEDGTAPRPDAGQVWVPVAYEQEFDLQRGDELQLPLGEGHLSLTIEGFVRDAQMASSLSSATRFVISEADFAALEESGTGEPEVIVEYRLEPDADTSAFQRAYERDDSLPRNGQAVTYTMIRLINIFSDGLVAGALIFVSALLILIALFNLRFVIRGSLEDDVREIGALKALGIPDREISALYLNRYRWMTLAACVVGGLLALGATSLLTRSISTNYATAGTGVWRFVVPLAALALVYLVVVGSCRGILRRIRKIEVVAALVQGSVLDQKQTRKRALRQAKRARRSQLKGGTRLNARLAAADLRSERGQWVLVPIVFALAAIVMTIPLNLLSTFSSPKFVTYLGAPQADLRTDVQWSPELDSVYQGVLAAMRADDRISDVRPFANEVYEIEGEEGWEALRVQVGSHEAGDIEFVSGGSPEAGEIAVSVLNADKYDLSVGDTVTLRDGDRSSPHRVSGTYADVTSGGYTAKMQGEPAAGAASYVIYADTADGETPATVAAEYDESHPGSSTLPMAEYVSQTLGYVTSAFKNAAIISFVFALGVALLVCTLFLKLRLTRDRKKMAILYAVGFSSREIGRQVLAKTVCCALVGTAVGVVLTATVGERLVGALLAATGLGLDSISFLSNPFLVYLLYPLCLVAAGCLGAVVLVRRLSRADKSGWLRED
ncbi:ABC transporter permease [Nocardioides sp. GXZ039]|uniref:ABC transporter permease n=1 Tax=Nocardioides sp. GXZ039 TaxID=3136018 RepID=UPI0030F40B84